MRARPPVRVEMSLGEEARKSGNGAKRQSGLSNPRAVTTSKDTLEKLSNAAIDSMFDRTSLSMQSLFTQIGETQVEKLVKIIRDTRRVDSESSPSPLRVPARVFSRVLRFPESLPSLLRVLPESTPSPLRVRRIQRKRPKRLGRTRSESFPSLPSPLRRAKYDVEGQKGRVAHTHRLHFYRHGRQHPAAIA